MTGLIRFKSGEKVGIEGSSIWRKDNRVGIEFSNPLPSEIIIREHESRSVKFKKT